MSGTGRRIFRNSSSALALATVIFLSGGGGVHAGDRTAQFDIPAENTAQALMDFSRQSGVQILYPYDVAASHQTRALHGRLNVDDALSRLLDGSGLEVAEETDASISLKVAGAISAVVAPGDPATEVIVTGTRIRGANPTSPVHTVTRSDIEQSGYSQIGDLVRSLPENFAGGQNPGVIGAAATNVGNDNYSNASTVNLRGLGTDATLVLLNGHRLAADTFFQGSDISGIPLAAVQRIEIVPDGASALYGSDAVAGVANFILRKSFSGNEFGATVGGTTQGGGAQQTYSWLSGIHHDGWHALGALEYSKQDGVTASQRDFTSAVAPWTTLYQPQTRASAFFSGGADISDRVSVSADLLVSDRRAHYRPYFSASYLGSFETPAYNAALSADIGLAGDWKLHATGVASGSRNNAVSVSSGTTFTGRYRNDVDYAEATADGTLLHLPSGNVRTAFGGGYRDEGFRFASPGQSGYFTRTRSDTYAFAEASIPVVEPSLTRTGLQQLEVNLSARSEDYSDLGRSTNPRVGIRYVPFSVLTLRATWGKSFKAPSFYQMYKQSELYLYPAAVLGYAGGAANSAALWSLGGNPDLKPERSTSWTLGADFAPPAAGSMKLSATLFGIDYKDRVVQPVADVTQSFSSAIYAPFVTRSPSSQAQAALIASSDVYYNYSGYAYDPSTVVGIVHDTYQNATAQTVTGFDLSYRQLLRLKASSVSLFANATWLRLRQQTIITEPDVLLSGTIFNPPDFRGRSGLTWQQGSLTATGVVNVTSGETDTGVSPPRHIGSWTTADATFAWTPSAAKGVRVALAATNLLDRKPPHASSPALAVPGLYFDSTNASILGRLVSLSVTKDW